MQHRDELTVIFKRRLSLVDVDKETVQDLIFEVVAEYMAYLMSIGNIPQYLLDNLESDLKEEVIEIYRKTTYGYLTLKDFKEAGKQNGRRYKSRTS
jgi:hypothetical protein